MEDWMIEAACVIAITAFVLWHNSLCKQMKEKYDEGDVEAFHKHMKKLNWVERGCKVALFITAVAFLHASFG